MIKCTFTLNIKVQVTSKWKIQVKNEVMSNQLLKSIKILNRFPRKLWPLPPNAPHYVIQRIVEYFPESIESWCGILRIWMLCLWEMEQVGPIIILQRNRGCEKNLYLSKLIYWTLHQTKNIQFGLLFSRVPDD